MLGRLGGDEFAALLTNANGGELDSALRRLRENLDRHNYQAQRGYDIAYSVGAVQFDTRRHADIEGLMAEADAVMYQQKKRRQTAIDTGQASISPDRDQAVG